MKIDSVQAALFVMGETKCTEDQACNVVEYFADRQPVGINYDTPEDFRRALQDTWR